MWKWQLDDELRLSPAPHPGDESLRPVGWDAELDKNLAELWHHRPLHLPLGDERGTGFGWAVALVEGVLKAGEQWPPDGVHELDDVLAGTGELSPSSEVIW